MNYLSTTKANKNAVVYVLNGAAVASFPASLNARIPEIEEIESMCAEYIAPVKAVAEMKECVTTVRVANGEFKVFLNGKETKYYITNGSKGLSGNGVNQYMIVNVEEQKYTMIGSLAKAKKTVAHWIKKGM